jgi:limonene-1,2-epoxide hydrolase
MSLSRRDFAAAFSSHDFEPTFSQISGSVIWRMPGSPSIEGRRAVIGACRSTVESLADTEVKRDRFLIVDGGENVVVDTLTTYRDGTEVSTVASCDIYEFDGDILTTLTSYNLEA